MLNIEIDASSGFCFGVTTAISKAEEELATADNLCCLGDIVHNGSECERLQALGLRTFNHDQLTLLKHGTKVLLRAHGEPPATMPWRRKGASASLMLLARWCCNCKGASKRCTRSLTIRKS